MRPLSILLFSLIICLPGAGLAKKKKKRRLDYKCISDLRRTGTSFKLGPYLKGMRTPVTVLNGRIGKLQYLNGRKRARPIMDCRAALALYRVYPIIVANGDIASVLVGKFYAFRYVKNSSTLSRHAMGLGIDIYGIKTKKGKIYMVDSDYKRGLAAGKSCEGQAKTRGARLLRQLACDLDRSHYFRAILTPDSDRDHRDHFHISVYKHGEKRTRKYRTTLIEPQFFGRRWVKLLPKYGYPSLKRVWKVVRQRRRANRRLIRSKRKRSSRKR